MASKKRCTQYVCFLNLQSRHFAEASLGQLRWKQKAFILCVYNWERLGLSLLGKYIKFIVIISSYKEPSQ